MVESQVLASKVTTAHGWKMSPKNQAKFIIKMCGFQPINKMISHWLFG
jgi:hypothetical protein